MAALLSSLLRATCVSARERVLYSAGWRLVVALRMQV